MKKRPAVPVPALTLALVASTGILFSSCHRTPPDGFRARPAGPQAEASPAPAAVQETAVVGLPETKAAAGDQAPSPGYRHEELEKHFQGVIQRNAPEKAPAEGEEEKEEKPTE